MPQDTLERLHKVLAHAGVASRRKAEEMIQEGRVSVNGQIVTELGTKVDPGRDDIRVDGERLKPPQKHVYLLINKPRGVLSTMTDERGRRALGDLVTSTARLYPVGRLDVNSEGLILLTDDGELANLLTHPRYEHEKEYRVLVNGYPTEKTLEAWRRGVVLEGDRTAPAQVEVIRRDKDGTLLRVIMHEGRKRQIRDVAALLGHPVRELRRVRMGPLQLGELEPGQSRALTPAEMQELRAIKSGAGRKARKSPPAARAVRKEPSERTDREGPPPAPGTRRRGPPVRPGRQGPADRPGREGPPARGGRRGPPDRAGREGPPAGGGRGGPPERSGRRAPRDRSGPEGRPQRGRGEGPPAPPRVRRRNPR